MMLNLGGNLGIIQWDKIKGNKRIRTILRMCGNDVCVCDKIDWMENGWMDWIEWIWMWKVESGQWKVEGGAVPDLTQARITILQARLCLQARYFRPCAVTLIQNFG